MTDQQPSDKAAQSALPDGVAIPALKVNDSESPALTAAPCPSLSPHHLEFAEFQESYVRNYISLADTKASWTFAVSASVMAYLITQAPIKAVLLHPACGTKFPLVVGTICLLTLSGFFAFLVIAPRLSAPSKEGLVFFDSVAQRTSADEYVADITAQSDDALKVVRLRHCYDVSRVCAQKYANLRRAIWVGLPALPAALLTLLLVK